MAWPRPRKSGLVENMLNEADIITTLPVVDLERASEFYGKTLGLKEGEAMVGGRTFLTASGTSLFLYQRSATKADHTVLGFMVNDIEAEVTRLRTKGVTFEEYDIPEMNLKTVKGIATTEGVKSAWFKDTEGNILSVTQAPDSARTSRR